MSTDLQGVALVIAACGTVIAASGSAIAAIWAVKTRASVTNLGHEINGRMTEFMATKDQQADQRVEASYKAGELAQKTRDEK